MAAIDAARVAVKLWPKDLAITMVAIAGGESGWDPNAGGDSPAILARLGHVEAAQKALTWNCPWGVPQGYASWGLWQIFMPYHKDKIARLGGPIDHPCNTAEWLKDPWNNARVANEVYKSQGLAAWTVYRTGVYTRYVPQAREAVAQALAPTPVPVPEVFWLLPALLALTGTGVLIWWWRTKPKEVTA